MQKSIKRLVWPAAGVNKRYAVQSQPPFSAPLALNCINDAISRERGGSRPGLAKAFTTDLSSPIRMLNTVTYTTASGVVESQVVALAGAAVYYSDSATTMAAATLSADLSSATTRIPTSAEYGGKLYILVEHDSPASSLGLKVYSPLTHTVSDVTPTDGSLPTSQGVVTRWRDRIVIGGGNNNPFLIAGSRMGDPLDWDFTEATDDVSASFYLPVTHAGQIGDHITALIPHSDDCLVVGCRNSMWIVIGDPNDGGTAANVSPTHGIIDRNAWCNTPDGRIVFLSHDGLYMIQAGCGVSQPKSMSREVLPQALLNLSALGVTSSDYAVSLAYDQYWRGIWIFTTLRDADEEEESGQHYFFDWETKGFWPVKYGTDTGSKFEPWCCHARRNFQDNESIVLLGCTDGYIRVHDSSNATDDTGEATAEAFESYVLIGPFGDQSLISDVRWDELITILAADSADVTVEIYRGDTAEAALSVAETGTDPDWDATIEAGRSYTMRPRVRGPFHYLKLIGTGQWAYEAASAVVAKGGRVRV